MKRKEFKNGIQYKLKNRRVTVLKTDEHDIISINCKRLFSKEEISQDINHPLYPYAVRGIIETGLFISYEAGIALYKALGEFIKLSDIPSHLLNKEENEQI
jgi:hypothetical protein